MKKMSFMAAICLLILIISCRKTGNDLSMEELKLIQHKWSLVSNNGEAFRYVGMPGDYYNFDVDNILYRSINNNFDTFHYSFNSYSKILSLSPITNGIKLNETTNYEVKILNNNSFVFGYATGIMFVLDSLKR